MELDPKTEITLAAGIMQGLLSTGHYTQPNPKGSEVKWLIRRGNAGENWEAEGYRFQYPAFVVDDAIMLLTELNKALSGTVTPALKRELEALTPKKPEPKPVAVRKAAKKRKR